MWATDITYIPMAVSSISWTQVHRSQFTSEAFTSMLLAQGVQVSMDGRGRCMDNVFHKYNQERPHQYDSLEIPRMKVYGSG